MVCDVQGHKGAVKTFISPLMRIDLRPQGRMGRLGCLTWRIYLHEPKPIPIPHINPQLIFGHGGFRYCTLNYQNVASSSSKKMVNISYFHTLKRKKNEQETR